MKHKFTVILNDEEAAFIKKLAEYDGITVDREVQQLTSLQIWEEMQVQEEFLND